MSEKSFNVRVSVELARVGRGKVIYTAHAEVGAPKGSDGAGERIGAGVSRLDARTAIALALEDLARQVRR